MLTTEEKAAAIKIAAENAPYNLPAIIAMLTSANKEERESAKYVVREMVRYGRTIPPI